MSEPLTLDRLHAAANEGRVQWHLHVLVRCMERQISRDEVLRAVLQGEVIQTYPDDRPYPSCLLHFEDPEPLHVVVALEPAAEILHIITVYRPDLTYFESDKKTRRRKP